MGSGIAAHLANAGIPVTLLEISESALQNGLAVCRRNYERSAQKGRMSDAQVEQRMNLIHGSTAYADLEDADLVEAGPRECAKWDPAVRSDRSRADTVSSIRHGSASKSKVASVCFQRSSRSLLIF